MSAIYLSSTPTTIYYQSLSLIFDVNSLISLNQKYCSCCNFLKASVTSYFLLSSLFIIYPWNFYLERGWYLFGMIWEFALRWGNSWFTLWWENKAHDMLSEFSYIFLFFSCKVGIGSGIIVGDIVINAIGRVCFVIN